MIVYTHGAQRDTSMWAGNDPIGVLSTLILQAFETPTVLPSSYLEVHNKLATVRQLLIIIVTPLQPSH